MHESDWRNSLSLMYSSLLCSLLHKHLNSKSSKDKCEESFSLVWSAWLQACYAAPKIRSKTYKSRTLISYLKFVEVSEPSVSFGVCHFTKQLCSCFYRCLVTCAFTAIVTSKVHGSKRIQHLHLRSHIEWTNLTSFSFYFFLYVTANWITRRDV